MSMNLDAKRRSEMLKQLRVSHADKVVRTQELVKKQKKVQSLICQVLREKSRTVPDISELVELPSQEVLWYLTAFKKYDLVQEDGMCGEYILYKLAQEK